MRAQAVRDMSGSAEKVVVLAESEKFRSAGTVPMNLRCPLTVITDSLLEERIRTVLTSQGIEIITAE
jgi:DeoR/GlpR family transcriptional regulator of sugar metabolism